MKIDILSLFPEMFEGFLNTSIIKRAIDKEVVDIKIHNFREFTQDKHKHVDDYHKSRNRQQGKKQNTKIFEKTEAGSGILYISQRKEMRNDLHSFMQRKGFSNCPFCPLIQS